MKGPRIVWKQSRSTRVGQQSGASHNRKRLWRPEPPTIGSTVKGHFRSVGSLTGRHTSIFFFRRNSPYSINKNSLYRYTPESCRKPSSGSMVGILVSTRRNVEDVRGEGCRRRGAGGGRDALHRVLCCSLLDRSGAEK